MFSASWAVPPGGSRLGAETQATFITWAPEHGVQLEEVRKAAARRDPGTAKLYDRRGYNPEKAASFFATYRDDESTTPTKVPARLPVRSAWPAILSGGL